MISEGSYDTDDWRNDEVRMKVMMQIQLCITGINYILNKTEIENSYFKM